VGVGADAEPTTTPRPRASRPARIMKATLLPRSRTANPVAQRQTTDGEKNRAALLLHPIPEAAPVLFSFYLMPAPDASGTSANTHSYGTRQPIPCDHLVDVGHRPAGVGFGGWTFSKLAARQHEAHDGVGQREEGIDSSGSNEQLFLLLRCFAEGAFLQLAFTAAGCLMNQECGYHKQQVDSH